MKYEQSQFFTENEYDDVRGFTILEAQDGKYHIAEKWLKDNNEDAWIDYWVSESDLLSRVENNACEPHAMLTNDQFEKVCKNVGWRYDNTTAITA